jgi:hypothetical protein
MVSCTLYATDDTNTSTKNTQQDIIEQISADIQNDIKKDGTNFSYNLKLTHLDACQELGDDGIVNQRPHSTLFLNFGIRLLPNTWKIDISYTGTIGENILFKSSGLDEFDENLANYNGNILVNDPKKDTSWVDFYTKPLSTSKGDFGFGYTYIEQSNMVHAYDSSLNAKVLNLADANNNAQVLDENNSYIKYNTKTSRIYFTYNIPKTNSWYDGFGVTYGYEKTDRIKVIKPFKSIVVKPDTTSHIFSFGINKTLDEINTGLSFKTLTYGLVQSSHKYYNYDTKSNETHTNDSTQLNAEIILMFKPSKSKQFYINTGIIYQEENDDKSYYSEAKLELGMLF